MKANSFDSVNRSQKYFLSTYIFNFLYLDSHRNSRTFLNTSVKILFNYFITFLEINFTISFKLINPRTNKSVSSQITITHLIASQYR